MLALSCRLIDGIASMSLLALPLELRELIWDELVGRPFIHIHQPSRPQVGHDSSRQMLHHRLCIAPSLGVHAHGPSSISGAIVLASNGDSECLPFCSFRHAGCLENNRRQLSIAFLRTCRQIHYEAESLVYSSSTFSFDDDRALADFEASLNGHQKSYLTSVHLSIVTGLHPETQRLWDPESGTLVQPFSTVGRWHLTHIHQLSAPMAKFKLLKYLHICLNQQWSFHVDYTWLRDLLESTSASENVTVVLEHHFRDVTFGDLEISPFHRPSYRADWPADKQAKYAETLHVSLTSFWREQQTITLCRINATAQHDSAASKYTFYFPGDNPILGIDDS